MHVTRARTRQLLRRLTLGSGPLKRTSDRIECLARVLVVCSVLAAALTALVVALSPDPQARAQAVEQAADRHRVTARLVEAAPEHLQETWSAVDMERADAVWTDAGGTTRQVSVTVPAGTEAGASVTIWVDRAGDRTTRPLTHADLAALAVGQGIGTGVLLSVIAFSACCSVRVLLDRSRSRRWAADWAAIEPQWTGRLR